MANRCAPDGARSLDQTRDQRQVRADRIDGAGLRAKSSANNNDDDFESQYASDAGRLSRRSGQSDSTSSSASDQYEQPDRQRHHNQRQRQHQNISPSSSPARSAPTPARESELESEPESAESVSVSVSSSPVQLVGMNLAANKAPETRETLELVERVRSKFIGGLKESNASLEEYEESDLEELRRKLSEVEGCEQSLAFRLISRFLNLHLLLASNDAKQRDKCVAEAAERLNDLLKFRRQFQLAHLRADQFCKEIFLLNGMFQFGHDKQNLPVIYICARVHRRWPAKLDEALRKCVAWHINEVTKSFRDAKLAKSADLEGRQKDGSFGICFDCSGVSYSSVDIDFLRFLVRLLVNYYPTYCRYSLCLDLPWLFRYVWKMVQSWLPEDARNSVHLITARELTDFIDEDQIPNSIKYNNMNASEKPTKNKHQLPKNFDSLPSADAFARSVGMSSSEIKPFKSHVEKVCKDYEKLGAL